MLLITNALVQEVSVGLNCFSGFPLTAKVSILHKFFFDFASIHPSIHPSHRDSSFEFTQHMFWMRNKKTNFQLCTLIWRPVFSLSFR